MPNCKTSVWFVVCFYFCLFRIANATPLDNNSHNRHRQQLTWFFCLLRASNKHRILPQRIQLTQSHTTDRAPTSIVYTHRNSFRNSIYFKDESNTTNSHRYWMITYRILVSEWVKRCYAFIHWKKFVGFVVRLHRVLHAHMYGTESERWNERAREWKKDGQRGSKQVKWTMRRQLTFQMNSFLFDRARTHTIQNGSLALST